jgi:hypothetical protein
LANSSPFIASSPTSACNHFVAMAALPTTATSDFDIQDPDLYVLVAKYFHFNSLIKKELLDSIHLVKALLDGKKICEIYGIKQGKAIGKIIEEEIQYQKINKIDFQMM